MSYQDQRTGLKGSFAVTTASTVLCCINIIVHTLGSYLLYSLYKSGSNTVQMVYIINLSISEIVMCVLMCGEDALDLFHYNAGATLLVDQVNGIVYIVLYVSFTIYFYNMFLITGDRLMGQFLHIRYPIYWDIDKAKKAVACSWGVTVVTCVGAILLYRYTGFDYNLVFTQYVHTIMNSGFLVFATFTYSYIFYKYKQRRRLTMNALDLLRKNQKFWRIFRKSKFYVSVMLVFTFIIFLVIPNLFYQVVKQKIGYDPDIYLDIVKIFYQLAFLSDAFVYILIHPAVRAILWTKLGLRKKEDPYLATLTAHRNRVVRLDNVTRTVWTKDTKVPVTTNTMSDFVTTANKSHEHVPETTDTACTSAI